MKVANDWDQARPYKGVSDHRDKSPAHIDLIDPITWQGQTIPERKWVVDGWVPHGSVTMLGGDGGLGKSLIAMQLLTAAATGQKWLNLATMPCKAFGLFCEDTTDELWRRQAAINQYLDIDFVDLGDLQLVSRVGADSVLGYFDDRGHIDATNFYGTLINQIIGFGAQLVVVDSLHDVFAGNENNRGQARQFINLLRELALEIDGAVILTAHPSLQGLSSGSGLSGNTAWNNACRSRLYLKRDDDEDDRDARVLSRKKANYAAADDEIRVHWKEGVFVAEVFESALLSSLEARKVESVFLALLSDLTRQERPVSDNKRASNYAPRLFEDHPYRHGFKKHDFEKAMEYLFATDKIRVEEYGRQHDQRKRLVIVEKDGDDHD